MSERWMIPVEIDVEEIIRNLREVGWVDQKIEIVCGFSGGYVHKLMDGPRPHRPYQHVARLYNFWVTQCPVAIRQSTAAATS